MKLTILQRLALFARHRYRLVFLLFGLLVAASVVLSLRLSFDTDMLNLLPRKDPDVRAYIQSLEDFGSQTLTLVAIRLPEGVVAEPYELFADELAARLAKLPELRQVQHRFGEPEELLRTFFPKSVLFLDAEGRRKLAERLSDEGIRQRVGELRRQLSTPAGIAAKPLAKLDPLGLAEIFLGRVDSSRGSLQVDWTSGYYLSRDHRLLLLLAEPKQPPQDLKFNQRLAAGIDRTIAGTLADWERIAGEGAPKKPEVVVGGPHLTALGDSSLIQYDMVVNIVTSALGVFFLFLIAFRRAGSLLYAFVPLFSGLILTFGFAKLTIGTLSSATSVVAAMLIGLGIDFVIVSYGRYVEERRKGAGVEAALLEMNGTSGQAILVGAVTTTATFYAFAVTEFRGLRQMGLLTGTGILFCAFSTFLLLPALLAWSDDKHQLRQTQPNHYLHSFGSDRLTRLCLRHRGWAIAVGLALCAAALYAGRNVRFDESMKTMRPEGNRGIDVAVEVGKKFGSGFDSMTLMLSGRTPEEAIELAGRATEEARALVREGTLYGFSGVTSLIPPPRAQREVLDWLAQTRGGALDLARIRNTFAAEVAKQGLRLGPFEAGLDLLGEAVSLTGPIGLADFQRSDETALLLDRYLKKVEGGWRAAVYLYPPSNLWRRQAPPGVVDMVARLGPSAQLAGTNLVNQAVRTQVIHDAWVAGIVGAIVVALMLFVNFRSLQFALLALAPVSVGILWMVGGLVLFGIQMNFINIFVTSMIIGFGVDYGVYVLQRYLDVRDLSDEEFEAGMLQTGKAVAAAAVSTIVGFGSITFSHYPGLVTTGKVAALGAFLTCTVAVTLLPTGLSWLRERRRRRLA